MFKRRLKPLIVPIFIPQQGCPHQCIFCEQEKITSQAKQSVSKMHVASILNQAVQAKHFEGWKIREVAFYGGTFTRLPMKQMKTLLETVAPYIERGLFHAIRVSTRPDAIDAHRLEMLRQFGVLTVELGVQSMNNRVLADSKRGHTAEDTIESVESLRAAGFKVGIQLMPGLPGDSKERFHSTVSEVILLKPDMVRLYPTVVIEGTELAQRYREGRYQPLSLDAAVSWCADACIRFEAEEIPVIRIGLMSSPTLLEEGQILAGPWHPAFGFLVRSNIHLKVIEADIPSKGSYSRITICAPEREIPLVRGYRNQGLDRIEKQTGARIVGVKPDDSITKGRVRIEKA